jgi:hypothetical protein
MQKYFILLASLLLGDFSRAEDTNSVEFGDWRVYSSMCAALGVPEGPPLTRAQVLQVTNLFVADPWGWRIESLEGLQYSSNLTGLGVSLSEGVPFEPLESLPHLKYLSLDGSLLGDVSALLALTNIIELGLNAAWVTNFSVLAAHPSRILQRAQSQVTNAEVFSPFWRLEELTLYGNAIRDVSAFLQLTNLNSLALGGNFLTNVHLLSNKTSLTKLFLGNCGLTNVEFVSGLTNLVVLHVAENRIQNIEALSELNSLRFLGISDNLVTNIAPLREIPLEWLDTRRNFLMATNYDYTLSTHLVFNEVLFRGGTVHGGVQGIWGTIRLNIDRQSNGLRVSWFRDPPQTTFRLWFATDGKRNWAIDPDFFEGDSFWLEINDRAATQWFWTELRIFGEQ